MPPEIPATVFTAAGENRTTSRRVRDAGVQPPGECGRRCGHGQTPLDVVADLGFGEWLQLASARHALVELPHARLAEHLVQVRLADEHDLQQLRLIGLEVREQADSSSTLGFRCCASSIMMTACACSGMSEARNCCSVETNWCRVTSEIGPEAGASIPPMMPKSVSTLRSRSSTSSAGSRITDRNVRDSKLSSIDRHSIVLPVPIAPVTMMSPSRRRSADVTCSSACVCERLWYAKRRSGVRLNGRAERPKNFSVGLGSNRGTCRTWHATQG